ncbi:MAG: hypothetical protein AAF368_12160 [Planctomycetota bacterium]
MTDLETNAARVERQEGAEGPRHAAASFFALSLLMLIGGALLSREEAAQPERVLPTVKPLSVLRYGYREHAEPDRTVSSIEFRLETRGENTAEIVVEASAVGPSVLYLFAAVVVGLQAEPAHHRAFLMWPDLMSDAA